MVTYTTITNPQVNSGLSIRFNGTVIGQDVTLNTSVPSMPGSDPSLPFNQRCGYGRNSGIGQSTITFGGVIDANQAQISGANAVITYEYLLALANRSDQMMTLTDDAFITSTNATGSKQLYLVKVNYGRNDTSNVRQFSMTFIEANS